MAGAIAKAAVATVPVVGAVVAGVQVGVVGAAGAQVGVPVGAPAEVGVPHVPEAVEGGGDLDRTTKKVDLCHSSTCLALVLGPLSITS